MDRAMDRAMDRFTDRAMDRAMLFISLYYVNRMANVACLHLFSCLKCCFISVNYITMNYITILSFTSLSKISSIVQVDKKKCIFSCIK